MLAYVWVTLWFAYTLPIMVEPLLRVGFFESGPSFSVILGVWEYGKENGCNPTCPDLEEELM